MTARVIGYTRVSTDEQVREGAGLDAQRLAIAAEARRRGWDVEFVEDAGRSARNLRRPGIEYALETLASGRAETLVATKLDRLSRSVLDFHRLLERSRREGWALIVLDVAVDTSTPNGEAMAGMVAVFAQLERRLIGERTSVALAARRAQGVRLGRPPRLLGATRARVAALRASGLSLRAVAAVLNDERVPTAGGGVSGWSATQVLRALR